MLKELFTIPLGADGIPLYSYGLLLVVGFLAALQLSKFLARRVGIDPEIFVTAGLIALATGVFGARLSHILENLSQYTRSDLSFGQNLMNAINLREGGLTYYGGFLLAFPATVLYGYFKKVPLRLGMDIVAPCLMVGLAFGRIGCFLNGCCYGAPCNVSWLGVQFPYESPAYVDQFRTGEVTPPADLLQQDPQTRKVYLVDRKVVEKNPELARIAAEQRAHAVHPAQLYSTITAFLIAGICLAYFTLPRAPGRVFALMMILEGPARFVLESLRSEPAVLGRLSYSMVIGLIVFAGGLILWFVFGAIGRDANPSRGFPAQAAA
jgi:phosphatidylglycerol:prolipoprotein diacylglycerol transferase